MVDLPYRARSNAHAVKPVHWVGDSKETLKSFPVAVRRGNRLCALRSAERI